MKPLSICLTSVGVILSMIATQRMLLPASPRAAEGYLGTLNHFHPEHLVLKHLATRLASQEQRPITVQWDEIHGPYHVARSVIYDPIHASLRSRIAGTEIEFVPVTAVGIREQLRAGRVAGFASVSNLSRTLAASTQPKHSPHPSGQQAPR